jgi:UTP--glucose-1-phosphate uridylyltransferase
VLDEARAAGIEHFVFVTGRGKSSMEDYFDHHVELEATLKAKNKTALLDELLAALPKEGEISYVRQMAPLGLGHAGLVRARHHRRRALRRAAARHDHGRPARGPGPGGQGLREQGRQHRGGGALPARSGAPVRHRGPGRARGARGAHDRHGGKARAGTEPSNLFISGRYILQPEIFAHLSKRQAGAGGEIQLTDAMAGLMAEQDFFALEYDGTTYDCGDKVGLLRANVAMALKRPDLADAARAALLPLFG